MATGERRASHSRDRRDARAKGRRIRAASAYAKREHTVEHFPSIFNQSNINGEKGGVGGYARVATNALAVVWHTRCESARGGLTPSSVRRYRKTIEGWHGPNRKTAW